MQLINLDENDLKEFSKRSIELIQRITPKTYSNNLNGILNN